VAAALGVPDRPGIPVTDTLTAALARRQLLIVLDNCEQVIVAVAELCGTLGNALAQARALGAAPGDLAGLGALVAGTQELRRFEPRGDQRPWAAAARRLGDPG
jgi:rhamnulokinase